MAVTDPTRLGCGRSIDDVWDHIGRPPDEHETTCPDCRAARTNLGGLAEAAHEMAEADQADPDLHVSPGVIARILQVARAEVRRGKILPLFDAHPDSSLVDLGISEQTIATTIRRTCDQMLGVQARRCHVKLAADPSASGARPFDETPATTDPSAGRLEGRPSALHVQLTVSVAPRVAITTLTQDVRDRVVTALAAEIGVEVRRVDISVEDIDSAF